MLFRNPFVTYLKCMNDTSLESVLIRDTLDKGSIPGLGTFPNDIWNVNAESKINAAHYVSFLCSLVMF